jgi:hypothetical protein
MKTTDRSCKNGEKRTGSCAEMTRILKKSSFFGHPPPDTVPTSRNLDWALKSDRFAEGTQTPPCVA